MWQLEQFLETQDGDTPGETGYYRPPVNELQQADTHEAESGGLTKMWKPALDVYLFIAFVWTSLRLTNGQQIIVCC